MTSSPPAATCLKRTEENDPLFNIRPALNAFIEEGDKFDGSTHQVGMVDSYTIVEDRRHGAEDFPKWNPPETQRGFVPEPEACGGQLNSLSLPGQIRAKEFRRRDAYIQLKARRVCRTTAV